MRTTMDIPDSLYRDLKVKAAREGTTLRDIALRAIRRELQEPSAQPATTFEIPVIRSSRPGTLNLTPEQIDDIAFS